MYLWNAFDCNILLRRGMLALYLTNLAAETGFNMLVFRNLISSVPNGEVRVVFYIQV